MYGTFLGLNTSLRGLLAQQASMDTTGHNISNVNTTGYSRQRADLVTTSPLAMPGYNTVLPGQIGTGVDVQGFSRMRDQYIDAQLRDQSSKQSAADTTVDLLQQVQTAFGEPSSNGINAQITKFFSAMQDLAKNPSSTAARQAFATQGDALARTFNNLNTQLQAVAGTSNARLGTDGPPQTGDVADINNITKQIATLNQQIKESTLMNQDANDLKDSRDNLLDQLSNYVNYTATTNNTTNEVTVTFGTTTPINLVDPAVPGGVTTLVRADLDTAFNNGDLTSGSAFADEQMWDPTIGTIANITTQMDSFVSDLVSGLNTQSGLGFDLTGATGSPLFTGAPTMAGVTFSPLVLANPTLIGAASSWNSPGEPGNGDNAAVMLQMAQAARPALGAGTQTWQQFYSGVVTGVSTAAQGAQQTATNQAALVDALTTRREAVSGVSIDEEMTNMLRFQHAYNAAARAMSAADEMLDTLINRTGKVGL